MTSRRGGVAWPYPSIKHPAELVVLSDHRPSASAAIYDNQAWRAANRHVRQASPVCLRSRYALANRQQRINLAPAPRCSAW